MSEQAMPAELAIAVEPFSDAELQQHLADPREVDRAGRWAITNTDEAEWALRKLVAIRAEKAEVAEQAKRWEERIDAWFQQAVKALDRSDMFFWSHLCDWALRRREETGKATTHLPSGDLRTTGHAAPVVVDDAGAFMAWAEEAMPAAVKVAKSVVLAELRRAVTVVAGEGGAVVVAKATGEVVPGVTVAEPWVSVSLQEG